MKQADHRDQAEQQLDYADMQITGNADALLRSAHTHALLALIDRMDELSYLVASSLGLIEE